LPSDSDASALSDFTFTSRVRQKGESTTLTLAQLKWIQGIYLSDLIKPVDLC